MLTHFTHRALNFLNEEVFQKSSRIQKLSIFQCDFTCKTFECPKLNILILIYLISYEI